MRNKNTISVTERLRERGNVFLALFGAVAIVGVIGGTAAGIMQGPMKVMSDVSSRAVTENEIMANTKMGIMAIAQSAYTKDCDNDGTVEPYPYNSDNTGKTGGVPTGGGYLPSEIETTRWTDPWGNSYTYCVWDHGTLVDDATCGGAGQNRLPGLDTTAEPAGEVNKQVSIAVLSAGPNRVYETTCEEWIIADGNADGDLDDIGDTPLIIKPAGSDDIVMSYTYAEAAMATSSNWRIQSNDITTAEITEDEVEIGGQTSGGSGVSATIGGSASALGGLKLASDPGDDSITGACNPANDQALRINTGGASKALEICDGGTWTPISGSSTTNQCEITAPVIADSGNAFIQDNTKLNGARHIHISNNYAYVTSPSGDSFTVIDISDPLNPVIANSGNAWVQDATKLDAPQDFFIKDNYAYITSYFSNSLTVIDISDPLNPVIANSGNAWVQDASKLDNPEDIAVSGNYAYIVSRTSNSLTVIDISDPLNPVIANSGNAWVQDATKLSSPQSIKISGNYAYVATLSDALTVVDISDPLNPVIANSGNAWIQDATKLDGAFDVDISGNYAYVVSSNGNSLTTVDISDPLNPVIANSGNAWIQDATKLANTSYLNLSGSYAFVTGSASHLTVIDISDPLNPVIANSGNAWVQDGNLHGVTSVTNEGNYAYVLSSLGDRMIVVDLGCDLTNPVAPLTGSDIGFDPELANCVAGNDGPFVEIEAYDTTGNTHEIWSDGTYFYAADGASGLHAFSFNGTTLTLIDTYDTSDDARGVWGDGTYIYVADDASGIHAFSFNGTTLTLEDSYDTTGNVEGVWGDGTYVYAADMGSGVHAFTFDGSSFTLIDTYNTPFTAYEVWGDGVYIYVADGDSGVHALNFNNATFTLTNSYNTTGAAYDVWGDGSYIYVADGSSGIHSFIFDGANFTLLGTYNSTGDARGVWSDGAYVYLADGVSGIHALNFNGSAFELKNTYNTTGSALGSWGDGTHVYASSTSGGIYALSGFECTKAGLKTPSHALEYDYTAEQLFESQTSAGGSAESYGTAILLKSNEFGDEAGFSVNVDSAPADDDIAHASITAARTGVNGEGALLFKTQDDSGNLNTNMMFDSDGDFGINTSAPFNVSGKIQIGDLASSGSDYFDPASANCIVNNGGPLVEVDDFNTPSIAHRVWGDGTYVYLADTSSGLHAFSFDGTTLTQEDVFDTPNEANDVWGDGTYIYVADGTSGIRAYTFDGTTLVEVGSYDTTDTANGVWGDGSYIYVADNNQGLRVFSFDGTTFTEEDFIVQFSNKVWGDGTYIYAAGWGGGIRAYTFDGTTLTQVGGYDTTGSARDVWGDGTYIYVADNSAGILALTFDGSTFTEIDSFNTPDAAYGVWGDGLYIYVGARNSGLRVYAFDGESFTEEESYDTAGLTEGVWGDGTHIYIADFGSGIRAFSGFECTAVDGWQGPTRGLLTSIGNGACDTSSFAPIDTDNSAPSMDVWGDGTYIYGSTFGGAAAYSFDGTTLTHVDSGASFASGFSIWADSTTNIYTNGGELTRYTFNGATINPSGFTNGSDDPSSYSKPWGDGTYVYSTEDTLLTAHALTLGIVGAQLNIGAAAQNIWGDGTYIYVALAASGIKAYTFNGTNFTEVGTHDTAGSAVGIHGDGTHIYVADSASGVEALTFDGATFTSVGTYDTAGNAYEVWSDNGSVYVADGANGVVLLTFNSSTFTEIASYDTAGTAVGIWGDGSYIYVSDGGELLVLPYLTCGEGFTGAIGFFGNDGVGDVDTNILFSKGLGIKGTNADASTLTDILSINEQGTTTFDQGTVDLLDEAGAFDFLSSSSVADTAPSLILQRNRGTKLVPLSVASNDILGALTWAGYDGTGIAANGNSAIYAKAIGTPSNDIIPNGLFFSTNGAGDTLGSSDLALLSTGKVGAGTEAPLEALHVSGRLSMTQGLKIGYDNKCNVTHDQGFVRYVASDTAVEYCTAREWISITQQIPNIGFNPNAANCTRNAGGPFREIISETDSIIGFPWAIWSDGPYVYVGDNSRLRVYSFDGIELTEIDMLSAGDTIRDIWGDGTYIYTARDDGGIYAHTFDGTSLTQEGFLDTAGSAKELYSDGTYIYLADDTNGLKAYSFDGSTFTEEGSFATTGVAYDVWADGNYIYVTDSSIGLVALTFDGSTFTSVGTFVPPTPSWGEVWSDGSYIYYADFGELYALTFNGSGFTQNGWVHPDPTSGIRDIWGDGTYIYATNNDKFSAYSFNGTTFILKEAVDTTPADHHTIWGDGTYIYMAIPNPVGELGFKIYSGFECLSTENETEIIAWDGVENTEMKITASDGAAGDEFGYAVDIEGNYTVVSAPFHNSSQGAAYIYDIHSGTELFKLTASDGAASDQFGFALDTSGNYAVISSHLDDDNGAESGSAYVFNITTGAELFKLTASDGAASDQFGKSIIVSGNYALIGAPNDDDNGIQSGSIYVFDITTGAQIRKLTTSDGVAGDNVGLRYMDLQNNIAAIGVQNDDDNGSASGSVYLFDIETGAELLKIVPADNAADDVFGASVKFTGDYVVATSAFDDDNGSKSGSAYIFDIKTGTEIGKFTPSDGAADDEFGHSLDVTGKYAIIGAQQDDDNGAGSGSVYIFDVTTGEQLYKLKSSDGAANDQFSFRNIAIDNNTMIIPARYDDDNGADSGSAYIYQGNWTDRHTSGTECYPDPFEFDDIFDVSPEEDHTTNTVTITGNVKTCTLAFAYDTTEQFIITKNAVSEPDGTYFVEVSAGDTIRVDLVNGLNGEVKPLIATLGDYRTMSTVTTP